MKTYQLTQQFLGYKSRTDPTNTDPRFLVKGSQNVLINDEEKISTRGGYTRLGAENAALTPCESSYDWKTSSNTILNLRSYGDELEVYLGTIDGVTVDAWTRVLDSWSDVDIVFDTVFDTTEGIDILLMVIGDDKIYDWSGAVTTIASATSNTITKNGTDTWGQARFLTAGTRKVLINGTEYTYTGGESTTTLTGVTPDPSSEAADSVATQTVRTNDNTPADGFNNDVIRVQNNQVWVGSNSDTRVYVSKDTSFTDYTFSSPRVSGEGALLTLDGVTRGFGRFQDSMVVFSGRDFIYKSEFEQITVSSTLAETLKIKKLKTSTDQTAQSQDLITELGDAVAFLTFEPALRILQNIEDVENPQIRNYSDPIKPDFDDEDFTNGHMLFFKNQLMIATPVNGNLYILQFRESADGTIRRFWQAPQILPVRRLAIISNKLHGHSSGVPETYELFTGKRDQDNQFKAIATFAYNNFGNRVNLKSFNEYFTEGYIGGNTKIKVTFKYDYGGAKGFKSGEIDGTDEDILKQPDYVISLGQAPLGQNPLGGSTVDTSQNPKFKVITPLTRLNFTEFQVVYETDTLDYQWEIISHGPNAIGAASNNIKIKKS